MTAKDRLVTELFALHGYELSGVEKKFSQTSTGYEAIGQIERSKYGIVLPESRMTALLETNQKLKELYVAFCLESPHAIR